MSLLWQCTGFLERFYLMLGAAKPQILAYWANSWQKASYIRGPVFNSAYFNTLAQIFEYSFRCTRFVYSSATTGYFLVYLYAYAGFVQIINSAVFLSLSLCSLRFVSLTLSELEFLLSNMKVPYFFRYHVCRITVPILPWIDLLIGYSCCSLVLISQVSKSKSLICMCSCINI